MKERVQAFFEIPRKPIQQLQFPYLYTLIFVAITLILTYCFASIYFETNDAGRMMYQMAGYYTGEVEPITNFVGLPLCTFITMLYSLVPNIPWFALVLSATFIMGYVLMAISICKILIQKQGKTYLLFFMILVIYGIAILYPITHLHVYYSVIILGTSLVCMIMSIDFERDGLIHYIMYFLVGLLYIFLCLNQGFSATLCALVFICIALFYRLVHLFKEHKKAMIILILCSIVVVGFGFGAYSISTNIKDSTREEYSEYNDYRLSFTDYPHKSYYDDPTLYESIGWSEAFYNLANENHYLIDDKINVDNLSKIVSKRQKVNLKFENIEIIEVLYDAKVVLFGSVTTICIVGMMIILFLITAIYQLMTMDFKKLSIWLSYACCVIAVGLILYLCLNGRFLKRVALTVIIPACISQLLFVIKSVDFKQFGYKGFRGLAMCSIIPCLIGGYSGLESVIHYSGKDQIKEMSTINRSIENYAQDHPDNIYIYGIETMSIREPFVTYHLGGLKNLFNYGTAYTYTPMFYKQLKLNGHDLLNTDSLMKDDVFYVASNPTARYTFNLVNYLYEKYDVIAFEVVEKIDDLYYILKPYKLPLQSENYTGVVGALGKKYYVKNGEIQSGIVDGYDTTISKKVVEVQYEGKTYFVSTKGWIKDDILPTTGGEQNNGVSNNS